MIPSSSPTPLQLCYRQYAYNRQPTIIGGRYWIRPMSAETHVSRDPNASAFRQQQQHFDNSAIIGQFFLLNFF
jgi:hypothetical protein